MTSNKSPLLRAGWECTKLLLLQWVQARQCASPAGLNFGCCTRTCQWPTVKGGASHKLLLPEPGLALRRTHATPHPPKKSPPLMLQNDLQ